MKEPLHAKGHKTSTLSKEHQFSYFPHSYSFNTAFVVNEVKIIDKPNASDAAMLSEQNVGGIDFDPELINLQIQNSGDGIRFDIDPAMLDQLKQSPGFVPAINTIQPMTNLPIFLGIADQENASQLSKR